MNCLGKLTSSGLMPRLLLLVLLTGCTGNGAGQLLSDYQQKLVRVLEQPVAEREAASDIAVLPRRRDLNVSFTEESLNLIEFFQLMNCELHELIADHNSSLGKLGGPSTLLIYQLKFLSVVDACIAAVKEDHPDLADLLGQVKVSKVDSLPGTIWQATLAGPEFRDLWRIPVSTDYTADGLAKIDSALARLNFLISEWLDGHYDVDGVELEKLLGLIRQGDGGALLAAWREIHDGILPATRVLELRLGRKALCYPGMTNPRADIFRNVIFNTFIAEIQPHVAKLNRRYYQVMTPILAMEEQLAPGETPAFRHWRQLRQDQLTRFRDSIPQHVHVLEPLLRQCGLLPPLNSG